MTYHSLVSNQTNISYECINGEYEECNNGVEFCMGGPYEQYVYKLNYTGIDLYLYPQLLFYKFLNTLFWQSVPSILVSSLWK